MNAVAQHQTLEEPSVSRVAPDPHRAAHGRYGAYVSWSHTVDRTARTRNARRAGPGDDTYWLNRLPEQFADATEAQKLAAAEAAEHAAFQELARRSTSARRRGGGRLAAQ